MQGIIYGIYHGETLIYVGSTSEKLSIRWYKHLYELKSGRASYSYKIYEYMRNHELSEFKISEIETVSVENIKALRKIEGEKIRELNPQCNCRIAGRTQMEYNEENYDKWKNWATSKVHCECGSIVSNRNIGTHKKSIKHINAMK